MSWNKLESRVEKGPMSAFMTIFGAILIMSLLIGSIGYVLGWFSEAAIVAKEEFGPKAMLSKYEWFIDAAASIEKMDRDVALFQNRQDSMGLQFKDFGDNKSTWPPHVHAQYNQALQQASDDLLAVKSQRNGIVKDYNAQSEKFNWAPFQSRPDKPKERFHELL